MKCLFHRWELKGDTGFRRYEECARCGTRRADRANPRSPRSGCQPIDRRWLNHETDTLFEPMRPPRPNGRRVAERPVQ